MLIRSTRASLGFAVVALGAAMFSAGCMDSQREHANNNCGMSYVGRQRSACEMGVREAYNTARAQDGKSRDQKYAFATNRCNKLEPTLAKACTDGVRNF